MQNFVEECHYISMENEAAPSLISSFTLKEIKPGIFLLRKSACLGTRALLNTRLQICQKEGSWKSLYHLLYSKFKNYS